MFLRLTCTRLGWLQVIFDRDRDVMLCYHPMATISQRLQNILPDKMRVYASDILDHADTTLLNELVRQNKHERAQC
jgi:hypothetical protein